MICGARENVLVGRRGGDKGFWDGEKEKSMGDINREEMRKKATVEFCKIEGRGEGRRGGSINHVFTIM